MKDQISFVETAHVSSSTLAGPLRSEHTACSLKCLLAQASAGHENPKEAKESGMKFVGCEICTWDQRLPPAKSRLS